MKKTKIILSIILTTFLATTLVLAWVDLWTVNNTDSLTSTLWNSVIWKVNENWNKLSNTYTKAEVDALIANSSSWPAWSYCILQAWWSCPTWFTWYFANIRGISIYATSYVSPSAYFWDSSITCHWWAWCPYWALWDVRIYSCCK